MTKKNSYPRPNGKDLEIERIFLLNIKKVDHSIFL